jgi:hypothetical protein
MRKRDLLRVGLVLCIAALCAVVNPASVQADQMIFVAGTGNEFGTLDVNTGVFTNIGTMNLPAGDQIFGMGFGADKNLYAVDNQINANVWRIDTTTAAVTMVGTLNQTAIDTSADNTGKMFAIAQGANANVYTFNPPSLTTTLIGPSGITSGGLGAVNATGTAMFTSIIGTNPTYDTGSVNLTTGAVTDLTPSGTGFDVINGYFIGNTLVGFDFTKDAIVTINTTTGAVTQTGTYSLPNGDAILASSLLLSQIPEPSGLVLGLIATLVAGSLGVIRHRRRQLSL